MIISMFSRKPRRPKSPELLKAWESLDSGDIPGALRQLRSGTDSLPLAETALVVARAAGAAGFDDLEQAAEAVVAHPDRPQELYDYGYACVERGVSYLAVPALREALRLAPGSLAALRELVSAYEREERHGDAVEVLSAHDGELTDWPDRYLLVHNALMAGDLPLARRQHALLAPPEDDQWQFARTRQNRMLERAASAQGAGPVDRTDLRGWQYVLGGTVLGTLSPHGYSAGMTGRYAWLQDSYDQCLRGLLRLRTVLEAAGVRPTSVSLLPDRAGRVLGLAAAEVLGLPAVPFAPERADTVVVAYDLNDVDPEILGQLYERTPGQVLHEHASCWTDPPAVCADSVTLLHQSNTAPWAGLLRQTEDGGIERSAPDERPEEEIAADIVCADPTPEEGDDDAPADPDEALRAFVEAVRATWLQGERARLQSSGPVPSSRFM